MSVLRRAVAATVFLGCVGGASTASAQEMGTRGQLILSADRLVPLFSYNSNSTTETQGNTTTTDSSTGSALSLLWGLPAQNPSVHNIPRAAVDFTVIDNLTVGGAIAFAFGLGGTNETKATNNQNNQTTTTSTDAPKSTVFGLAPRVGYMIHFTDRIAFWPRAGFGIYSVNTRSETLQNNGQVRVTRSNTDTLFSLDLDPQFAFVPIDNFFFTVGPLVNIPLTGTRKSETINGPVTTSQSNDLSVFHLGITAGLGGYINL